MLSSLFSSVFSESENYFIYINQSIKLSELVLSSHNKAELPNPFKKNHFIFSLSLGTLAGAGTPGQASPSGAIQSCASVSSVHSPLAGGDEPSRFSHLRAGNSSAGISSQQPPGAAVGAMRWRLVMSGPDPGASA